MKQSKFILILSFLSTVLSSSTFAQATLDSTRTDYLLALFKQIAHPFVHACRAYYKHSDQWPEDSTKLVNFASDNHDTLLIRRFAHLSLSKEDKDELSLTFDFKPIKSRLINGENPSLITRLVGHISLSPPIARGSNILTYSVTILDAVLILPDGSSRKVSNYSQVLAEILPARY